MQITEVNLETGEVTYRLLTPEEIASLPVEEEAPRVLPKFYGNDKLDLFSQEEQIAIVTATMSDPLVKLTYDRLITASYLTYEDPEMEAGLQLLLTKELLTQERKDAIVAKMHG